jgi:hypothetical protein
LLIIVKRVHWLRARALKNRWHEEQVLVTYEMQWTVRYFINKSETWQQGFRSVDASLVGRIYARRQQVAWNRRAVIADTIFRRTTNLYMSPFT